MAGRGAIWDQARRAPISGAGFAVSGACVIYLKGKEEMADACGDEVSKWDGGPT